MNGKVALVTGGGSGIGRATTLAFAREGARVAIVDTSGEGGEETRRLVEEAGGQAIFVRADVSRGCEVEALVKEVVGTYGRLDCAFNNAGTEGPWEAFNEYPEEEWDRLIGVNLKGVWLCLKHEISQMLAQGGGAIVNTSSAAGLVGGHSAAYTASKHGVVGLTKQAALEHAQKGIRVNAVCPGGIPTPMLERLLGHDPERVARTRAAEPVGRFGTAGEVAEAVVWLCSDAASFVTGIALPVDGGWTAR